MSGRSGDDGAAADRESLRARAIWLAELATWRRGFVGGLVRRYGGLDAVLRLEAGQIGAAASTGRRPAPLADRGRCSGGHTRRPVSRKEADTEAETSRFAMELAAGPRADASDPRVVTWVDVSYPPQLRALPDPPPALFTTGQAGAGLDALASRHVVAIVGSRSPSAYGCEMAAAIARDLTAAGVLVVSGMALGIDAAAHAAALDASSGCVRGPATVGVLGCGADVEHPPGNRLLFSRVRAAGLLLSEFPWGVGARPWRFPARNRVMAGLAEAVVVVEGAERSGALITARYALELGREVLAVPGEAGRRLSAGPHRLIREGAALCESARDVLEVLGLGDLALGWRGRANVGLGMHDDEDERRLLQALDAGPRTADQLAAELGGDVQSMLARLAGLEVDGVAEPCGGGGYRLRRGGTDAWQS